MKSILAAALIAAAFGASLPARGGESTALPGAHEEADAIGFQMHPDRGRFHRRHVAETGLRCGTCHGSFGEDVLLLRPTVGAPQPVNREACLPCHQAPAKSTLYACPGRSGKALCVLESAPPQAAPATPTK